MSEPAALPKNFKERLSPALFRGLAQAVAAHAPLDIARFLSEIDREGIYEQELKARISTAARVLHGLLPPYAQSVDALIAAAPTVGMWENLVLIEIVQRHGLDDPDRSIEALRRLTPHGTGEFAIRPYINRYMDRMLAELMVWTTDDNEHVRRLAAEGTRPRGVWMEHIPAFRADPAPVIRILERLRADPSLYVRKAVANNLNDISKDHPELALQVATRWRAEGHPHTDWIVARGLRTLLKQGEARAHALLDRAQGLALQVEHFGVTPVDPVIGGEVHLDATLRSELDEPAALAVDYRLHFARPSGRSSVKVFQWTRRMVEPGERLALRTRQALHDLSTRRHHPGLHTVELSLNGLVVASTTFTLRAAPGA